MEGITLTIGRGKHRRKFDNPNRRVVISEVTNCPLHHVKKEPTSARATLKETFGYVSDMCRKWGSKTCLRAMRG